MLGNQLYGNRLIAESSRSVSANYTNKSSAQTADSGMIRAQLAIREISAARSAAELDESVRTFHASIELAGSEIQATGLRATRPQVRELYLGRH